MDNLSLGPDAQFNHAVASLRARETAPVAPLKDQAVLFPGLQILVDPEAIVEGTLSCGGGKLLSLDYKVTKPPRWLTLRVEVGPVDLTSASVFGVVCKSSAPEAVTMRVCLRSATSSGFVDAFLPKHVVAFGQSSTHVDLLKLEGRADVPDQAAWRDLILFLPAKTAQLDLLDLRIFIV